MIKLDDKIKRGVLMTEKDIQNQKNIEMHEANGVEIPYHQSVVIEENAVINRVIINNDVRISANTVANNDPEKIALISENMYCFSNIKNMRFS